MSVLSTDRQLPIVQDNVQERSNTIEQSRYACSLGALTSVLAIPRATPITHCGPGCASKQFQSLSAINGYQGGEFYVPSTNVGENEVVFGGTERLDELIESTLKIMDSDLYVVLSGCVPALVGDDVESVIGKYQSRGVPIVFADTSGFKGNNFTGHELITRAIIDQFVGEYDGPRETGTVNVWSLLPYQNTFWRGDLSEIKRLLEGIGLRVNILFGAQSKGVAEWKSIPRAQFNLVLSPWLGLTTARHLAKKYNQPYLHIPVIPIGAKQCGEFLRQVASFAGIGAKPVEEFIAAEEKIYYSYLRDFSSFYAGLTCQYQLPSISVVVSESAYNLAVTKFLTTQLGITPGRQIITENPPEEFRDAIRTEYRNLASDNSAEVDFEEDGYHILSKIQQTDFTDQYPIIFGTTWEGEIAKQLGASLVEVGHPATDEVVISRAYVGYRGALSFLERIFTTVARANTLA
jgi:nitrogenase molybdenum-iron protein beta chain